MKILNIRTNKVIFEDDFETLRETLVNAIMYHIKDLSGINGELRPGIVHRLDKDTSGLLIIAKNDKAHTELTKMFQNKEIKKRKF